MHGWREKLEQGIVDKHNLNNWYDRISNYWIQLTYLWHICLYVFILFLINYMTRYMLFIWFTKLVRQCEEYTLRRYDETC